MASNIDATVPANNVKVNKSDLRDNFQAAKEEIEELQRRVRYPFQVAFGLKTMSGI